MFFFDRITSIRAGDRVLEIGPGGTPHPRSNEFLDLHPSLLGTAEEAAYHRGSAPALRTDKPVTYYDGGAFPYGDKGFDYVICAHVLEHVPNVESFLSELFRIADRGYIEFPTIYYEYVYNIPVHVNVLTFRGGELHYMPKAETGLSAFEPIQRLFLRTLSAGHNTFVDGLQPVMFEGFEWHRPFVVRREPSLETFIIPDDRFPPPAPTFPDPEQLRIRVHARLLARKLTRKTRSLVQRR